MLGAGHERPGSVIAVPLDGATPRLVVDKQRYPSTLCTVTGGGHQWPGGDQLPYGGSPTPNLVASDAIADFFEAHPMP